MSYDIRAGYAAGDRVVATSTAAQRRWFGSVAVSGVGWITVDWDEVNEWDSPERVMWRDDIRLASPGEEQRAAEWGSTDA